MFDGSTLGTEKPWRVTRADYDRMIEAGILEDQKVELLHGVIVEMSPQGIGHPFVIAQLMRLFITRVADRAEIRCQAPLALSDDSEPEPDVYLAPPADYSRAHPSRTYLIVEVAMSSLAKDRTVKADLYAVNEHPEYWVVDIANRAVLVHRGPSNGRYSDVRTLREGDTLSVLQFPDVHISVSDILPTA